MKWTCQRGRLANQSRISLVLWVAGVVHDEVDVEIGRARCASTVSRNLRNSLARWRGKHWPMTLPACHVERGEQRRSCRGACSRGCAARPGRAASAAAAGCDRAPGSGSSRRRTAPRRDRAGRGRARRCRAPSRRTADRLDSLKVSLRCGCRPKARQMRCTVEADMADRLGHRAHAPVRRARRQCLQRSVGPFGDLVIADLARRARARLVEQARPGARGEALAPLADRAAENRPVARRSVRCEPPRPQPARYERAAPALDRSSAAAPATPTRAAPPLTTQSWTPCPLPF